MSKTQFKPILNTSLPAQFRQIRIVLAREPGHPEGDAEVAYIIVAPLDSDDRIDSKPWRAHRDACRIVRQRPDEPDRLGLLIHRRGSGWAFHYDGEAAPADEVAITSRPNVSSSANMSRSTNTARCIPTASRRCRVSDAGKPHPSAT